MTPKSSPVVQSKLASLRDRDECSRSMKSESKPAEAAICTTEGEAVSLMPNAWEQQCQFGMAKRFDATLRTEAVPCIVSLQCGGDIGC